MATARGMFDATKHPRGFHGRFGHGQKIRLDVSRKDGKAVSRDISYETANRDEMIFRGKSGSALYGQTRVRTRHYGARKTTTLFNRQALDMNTGQVVTVPRLVQPWHARRLPTVRQILAVHRARGQFNTAKRGG